MSVGEGEEDEPSEMEWCHLHETRRTCPVCYDEWLDRKWQDLLDRKAEP